MNDVTVEVLAQSFSDLRRRPPLVHNITNYVVMNFTANALLALGAAPVMAHAPEEIEAMVGLADALVINIGTLSSPWIDSMFLAVPVAARRGLPVILDPVGAGATPFRTTTAVRLLRTRQVTVVRANASEVLALAGETSQTRGVDSMDSSESARASAVRLAQTYRVTVAMTGPEDFVTDGTRMVGIANGHPLMARVTGTGCVASALTGSFCARASDAFSGATAALAAFGIAGELAADGSPGPGTYAVRLLDSLHALTPELVRQKTRLAQPSASHYTGPTQQHRR
jgi:hydroxyethylthiazole kinase